MSSQLAAKQGDIIIAVDQHLVQPSGTAPVYLEPSPFQGELQSALSQNVFIHGQPAATQGSGAENKTPHKAKGGTFVNKPSNKGKIAGGSSSVFINGNPAARAEDPAETCDDSPGGNRTGSVMVESGSVYIGG